jgi:hypothetical protein
MNREDILGRPRLNERALRERGALGQVAGFTGLRVSRISR